MLVTCYTPSTASIRHQCCPCKDQKFPVEARHVGLICFKFIFENPYTGQWGLRLVAGPYIIWMPFFFFFILTAVNVLQLAIYRPAVKMKVLGF